LKLNKLPLVQFIEYAVAMVVALPLYLLPHAVAFRVGEWLGTLLYWIMRRRRAIGYKNLTIAFGNQLSEQEKQHILLVTFRNLGKTVVEVLHFPKMSSSYLREKVKVVGQEHYLAADSKGKGIICLNAHIGNWEMSSHAWSVVGCPLNIVVRPLDNQFLDKRVTKLRTMHGNTLLTRRNSLKQIISALQNKELVGILTDQNTLRSKGIFADFFGKPACTIPVIAILALRYDVPVLSTFIVRTGFDTHTLHIGPEIEIQRTGDSQQDIAINTAAFNRVIEDFIRQHPDQWFWIHNRWKVQP
jgi:KDO2-lipid IV(A) lauroyltransferase